MMSSKTESPLAKRRVVKILNEEKINVMAPLPFVTSVPLSPIKQITNNTIQGHITNRTRKDTDMDHYVMHTVKGEADAEGYVGESIDFVLNDGEDKTFGMGGPSGEITEELHMSGDQDGEDGDNNMAEEVKTEEIIEHVCGKCYKSFRRINGLKKHLDFCRFDSGYTLRKEEMFKNLEKIEKDAITMDNKDICFCCGESYDTCHLGHISCPDCPRSFKTQSSYERHIFITHSEFNDHPCTVCNAKLRSENLLDLHIAQHKNRGKPYACKICGRDFTRSYHLKRHQKYSACGADQTDAMHCKVCNKEFFRLDNLRAHLKQHLGEQSTKKTDYMCPICKNCFYSLSTLNIHTRTHTGERPFDCDLCDKKFPSLVALKKHRRYHTGEKPYTCTVCSQSFAVKEVLNRHMKRHTGERPHVCTECKKSFIQATQLKNHMKTHLRPFECLHCSEGFKTEKQLIRHGKVHKYKWRTVKKGFSCEICGVSFRHKHTLVRHLKSRQHIDLTDAKRNKRTDCPICEKNFDTIKNLEFHILKVHEVDPEDLMNEKLIKETHILPGPKIVKIEENGTVEDIFFNNSMEYTSANVNNNFATAESAFQNDVQKEVPLSFQQDENHTLQQLGSEHGNHAVQHGIQANKNGVVVQEYIVDDLPSTSSLNQRIYIQNDAFTIIPLDSDGLIQTKTIQQSPTKAIAKSKDPIDSKIGIRRSLAESLAAAIADEEEQVEATVTDAVNEEDVILKENVSKLLDMLVDKATLKKFGWPENSVENVLCKVIRNCGHDLSEDTDNYKYCDFTTRMREYVKLLFTVVIQNDSIKELLNNYPIDEVIEYVLGNDDEDDNDSDDAASSCEEQKS